MRIIAGSLGGRRILVPPRVGTRPTSDRVREALFSVLGAPERPADGPFRVLDLYCGTGALALEALSRGADEAVLVEQDRRTAEIAQRNIDALGVTGRARLIRGDAGRALHGLDGSFDWVFVDPPYTGGALDRVLRILSRESLVAGIVIAEHDVKSPPADRYERLVLDNRRRWGRTAVSFFLESSDPSASAGAKELTPASRQDVQRSAKRGFLG